MPAADHETYTIESLIAELTSIAAVRGWGAQSLTNIQEIKSTSGDRKIKLLYGDEKDIEELEDEAKAARDNVSSLEREMATLERERDALEDRVAHLIAEVQSLKEEIRDMNA
jgi:septal ring factor EnvC (AmiA/AmiB activator)